MFAYRDGALNLGDSHCTERSVLFAEPLQSGAVLGSLVSDGRVQLRAFGYGRIERNAECGAHHIMFGAKFELQRTTIIGKARHGEMGEIRAQMQAALPQSQKIHQVQQCRS